jgi:ribonuclease BN (tRNA processing enzyme)
MSSEPKRWCEWHDDASRYTPMMPDRIVLLGTGTCQLQSHRMASSVLVELDAGSPSPWRLIYDFGRGVANRTAEVGLEQDDLEHVVLSHFHPDHLSDLIPYLQAASWSRIDPRTKDLHVYGPIGLEVQLMRLLGLFPPDNLTREHFRVHLHEIRGDSLTLGGRELGFCDLPPADNRGLKLSYRGRTYAFTGDSSFHPQEVAFLRGADLGVIDAGHLEDDEILELAAATQVPRIVCSHLYRELDEAEINDKARARGYDGRLIVGQDLMTFDR